MCPLPMAMASEAPGLACCPHHPASSHYALSFPRSLLQPDVCPLAAPGHAPPATSLLLQGRDCPPATSVTTPALMGGGTGSAAGTSVFTHQLCREELICPTHGFPWHEHSCHSWWEVRPVHTSSPTWPPNRVGAARPLWGGPCRGSEPPSMSSVHRELGLPGASTGVKEGRRPAEVGGEGTLTSGPPT